MSEMRKALEEMRQALMRGTCETALAKGYAALVTALELLELAEGERETGFTWGDDQGIEWLVIERDSGPWLFRRHPDGQFMSIREVRRITRKEAARATALREADDETHNG